MLKDLMMSQERHRSRLMAMSSYKSDIQSQMLSDRNRKIEEQQRDRVFTKPHFGPEESPDRTQAFFDKERRNRQTVRTWLDSQIQVSQGQGTGSLTLAGTSAGEAAREGAGDPRSQRGHSERTARARERAQTGRALS